MILATLLVLLCSLHEGFSEITEKTSEADGAATVDNLGASTESSTFTQHKAYILPTTVTATEDNFIGDIASEEPTPQTAANRFPFQVIKYHEDPKQEYYGYVNGLETLRHFFMEQFNRTDWEYALEKNQTLGLSKIRETQEEMVVAMKEFKEFVSLFNKESGGGNEFERDLGTAQCVMIVLDHIQTLVKLKIKSEEVRESLREEEKGYSEKSSLNDLDRIVENSEQMAIAVKGIAETIEVTSELRNFCDDDLHFESAYMSELLDVEMWKSRYADEIRELENWKESRRDRSFDIILRYYVNPSLQIITFVVGMLGNGILLIAFLRYREMRTDENLMIINLTFADLLSLLVNILFNGFIQIYGFWDELGLCKLYRYIGQMCVGVIVFSIVALSVQRCLPDTQTLIPPRQGFGRKAKNSIAILCVWLVASFPPIPYAIYAIVIRRTCTTVLSEEYFPNFILSYIIVFCAIPLIIIVVSSCISASRVNATVKDSQRNAGQKPVKDARLNILITLTVGFAVCYLPYYLQVYVNSHGFKFEKNVHNSLKLITSFLIYGNACFNPIALYLVDANFRQHMNNSLFCRKNEAAANKESMDTRL